MRDPTSRRGPQRGEGRLGCILWLILFLAVGLFGVRTVPVRLKASQLEDYMIEQTKFARRASPQELTTRILNKATELDLPVKRNDINVRKTAGRVELRCRYTVPVDLVVYTWEWKFDLDIERAIFIF